jgi:uncharacterized protein (DUF362 family)
MFDGLGGLSDVIRPGDHVGIKINLTGGSYWASDYERQTSLHPGEAYWTHPEVLRAVGELIRDAGAGKITVAEAIYDMESYVNWGYRNATESVGATFVDLNQTPPYAGYAERPADGGFLYESFTQNGILNDFDCLVSLAKSKRHNGAGVTHGIKNLVGTLPVPSGLYNNGQGHRAAIHEITRLDGNIYNNLRRVVLDLHRASPIRLVVNDAVKTVLGGEGPWGPGLTPVSFDTLVASKDPVAADAIGTQVIGFDPTAPADTAPFPDGLNYLTLASDIGMGISDPSQIDIVQATTTDVDSETPSTTQLRDLSVYPNPFRDGITVRFFLTTSGPVSVEVLNMMGQRIWRARMEQAGYGVHRVDWDGQTRWGHAAAPGAYVLTVRCGSARLTRKIVRV